MNVLGVEPLSPFGLLVRLAPGTTWPSLDLEQVAEWLGMPRGISCA